MRAIISYLVISLLFANSLFALDFKDKNTGFNRKSLLSNSVRNTGIDVLKAEKALTSSIETIAIADYVNYSSVSPSKDVNITRSVYTYLRATSSDVVNGDTYVYSEVKEVFQPIFLEETSPVIVQREELIAAFQKKLYQEFPNQSFEVSIESIQGLYTTHQEASNAQLECKSSKKSVIALK